VTTSPTPRRNSSGLRRDLELLEILGSPESESAGGIGVVRVAELAGRDKGQVSRTLATLADAGLAARDPDTLNYRLGHRLYTLAARTQESWLVREAKPFLRKVVTATHETAHLCVLRGDTVFTVLSELSPYEFRGVSWEGVGIPAWRTSSGRVLVSSWDEEDLRGWYNLHGHDRRVTGPTPPMLQSGGAFTPPEPQEAKPSITDVESLLREVGRIRAQGFAIFDEEFEVGIVGASAPVYDFRGQIVAAVNVSASKNRLGSHLTDLGSLVARVAGELSRHLGYRDTAE